MSELRAVIQDALDAGKGPEDVVSAFEDQGFSDEEIRDSWPSGTPCPLKHDDIEDGDETSDEVTVDDVPTVDADNEDEAGSSPEDDAGEDGDEGEEETSPPDNLDTEAEDGSPSPDDAAEADESSSEDEDAASSSTESEGESTSSEEEDGDEDDEDYSREDDVLTQEDFEEIEEEEDSKGLFASVASFFTSDEEDDDDDDDEEDQVDILQRGELSRRLEKAEDSIEDVEIDMSKIDGRIDVLSEKQESMTDAIDNVREKVGELRSTVLGRERSFNQLQEDFRKIKLIVDNFDQEVLDSKFDNITTKQTKLESSVERLESQLDQTRKQLGEYQDIMKKIKDYDNLLDKLDEVKEIKKEISSMKIDVEKSSSKAEVMVHNVQDSLKKMKEAHSLASTNEETIKDMTQDVSKLEAKTEGLVKKEKFEDLKADVEVMKENLFNQDFQE